MKILVLASEPITPQQLSAALEGGDDPARRRDTKVRIVAPALHESALQFWLSDADEAIAKAEAVWRASVDRLAAAGVQAGGDTGESDPARAIEDALATFDADRIVVFARREDEQRYREELDAAELERRFGRPVEHVSVSA